MLDDSIFSIRLTNISAMVFGLLTISELNTSHSGQVKGIKQLNGCLDSTSKMEHVHVFFILNFIKCRNYIGAGKHLSFAA